MVLIQCGLQNFKNSWFLKKIQEKNDGYIIKNGKIHYKNLIYSQNVECHAPNFSEKK